MGSFSVACTGSGISITSGDKSAFIPLFPKPGGYKPNQSIKEVILKPMSMIVSSDGASSLYDPFSLPIFGEYNDYGSLENIERNSTVEEIERFFNITIDQFMEVVTRNWCEDKTKKLKNLNNKEILQSMSGCFINKEVFDFLATSDDSEEGYFSFLKGANVNTETLKALKFLQFDDLQDPNERYKQVWKMVGDFKNTVYSDGEYSDINKTSCLYHPNEFIKEWNKVSNVKINTSEFENLSKYDLVYDGVVEKFIEEENEDPDPRVRFARSFAKLASMDNIKYKLPIPSWESSFKRLYKDRMMTKDQSLKKEFMNFFQVQSNMFSNNKIFMPMFSGPQCGDAIAQLKLAQTVVKILKKQEKERG